MPCLSVLLLGNESPGFDSGGADTDSYAGCESAENGERGGEGEVEGVDAGGKWSESVSSSGSEVIRVSGTTYIRTHSRGRYPTVPSIAQYLHPATADIVQSRSHQFRSGPIGRRACAVVYVNFL